MILNNSQKRHLFPKEVWIGWMASLVEAYNMAIYSFIAPILALILFQGETKWNAIFFSYALVFLGSSLLYPIGAAYYGSIGDREGRQKACTYSTLGLGIATGLMGIVPYHFLNDQAWILFLLLICGQYFFSGGEYYGSIVFSLEHAKEKQSGLMSALSCLFAVFGLAVANGFASLSSQSENSLSEGNWAIRACFLLGGIGGVLSYYLKNYCQETPAFQTLNLEKVQETPLWDLLKQEWKKVLSVVLVWGFFAVSYAFIFIFLPLIPFVHESTYTFDTFKSLIAYGVFLVLSGILADRIGIQKTILGGLGLFGCAVVPGCYWISHLFYLQLALTPLACLVIAPIHSWMLMQFEVSHRCRGMFVSSAISMLIFGGSAVPLSLKIYEVTSSVTFCATYPLILSLAALCSMLCVSRLRSFSMQNSNIS